MTLLALAAWPSVAYGIAAVWMDYEYALGFEKEWPRNPTDEEIEAAKQRFIYSWNGEWEQQGGEWVMVAPSRDDPQGVFDLEVHKAHSRGGGDPLVGYVWGAGNFETGDTVLVEYTFKTGGEGTPDENGQLPLIVHQQLSVLMWHPGTNRFEFNQGLADAQTIETEYEKFGLAEGWAEDDPQNAPWRTVVGGAAAVAAAAAAMAASAASAIRRKDPKA
ncbi:MAG: hypothetical protein FDZ70_10805, partial [Actinobacteria bacterium]